MEVISRANRKPYNKRTFSRTHYEDMWSNYDEGKNIVKAESTKDWSGDNAVQLFKQANKSSLTELIHWSKKTFKGSKKKLEKLMNKI